MSYTQSKSMIQKVRDTWKPSTFSELQARHDLWLANDPGAEALSAELREAQAQYAARHGVARLELLVTLSELIELHGSAAVIEMVEFLSAADALR